MREPAVVIHCDLCLYRIDDSASAFQIDNKDICSRCALVVKRADMFDLTIKLLKAIEERYSSMDFIVEGVNA
jgi:hypothetical protein